MTQCHVSTPPHRRWAPPGIGLLLLWAALLLSAAAPAQAQTEIRANFPFEGTPGTTVPDAPPVTRCQGTPDFAPAHRTTVEPFTGSAYIGFHERLNFSANDLEIFSIPVDQPLVSGRAYVYRFMARIAPISPAPAHWAPSNGGANSGSFAVYAGATPCAQDQLVGTVDLLWPADNAWTLRTLTFTANASYPHITFVAGDQPDIAQTTYFGIDDPRVDYGDAPDTFGTLLAANGARHNMTAYDTVTRTAPLMLGPTIDPEADGEPHVNAILDADDSLLAENITLTAGMTTAQVRIAAVNTTASAATLAGWIDFNGSGTFEPAERTQAIVPANTAAPTLFTLTWNGFAPIPAGFSGLSRFRIATNAAEVAAPIGAAGDGEVEDYRLPIALDCGTGTAQSVTGVAQAWTPDSIWQGGQPVFAINVPDSQGVQLNAGSGGALTLDTATVVPEGQAVTLYLSQPADPNLRGSVLIESSRDGITFGGAVTYGPGASLPAYEPFTYVVPAGGLRFVRIRPVPRAPGDTVVYVDALTYSFQYCECGGATNGVQQSGFEEFPLCSLQTGAFGDWRVIEDSIHIWGATCSGVGWPSPVGEKSMDLDGMFTGGAEQTITGLNPGQRYNLTFFMGFNPSAGALAASMRLTIGDVQRVYTSASSATAGGFNRVYIEFTAQSATEVLRFESLTGSGDPTLLAGGGTSGYGVVIDEVRITTKYCDDYGDAPGTYGGAWHSAAGPTLGALRDNEVSNQASFDARGDDLSGNDEDGLVSVSLLTGATTASAVVNATNPTATPAMLAGWIDFDNNGLFEPPERMHVIVPANTVTPTPFTLNWAGLAPIPAGFSSFARFRIAHSESELFTAGGGATAGEVEDYTVPTGAATTTELLITKSATPNPAAPGGPLTYTITVFNNGPASVLGARVLDPLPPDLAAFTWTCMQPVGACSQASGTGAVDTLVNLAPGTQAVITVTGTLPATATGTVQNTVTLTPPPDITPTCPVDRPDCLTSTVIIVVMPRYDLGVTKIVDDPAPTLNQRVTFTITVSNSGPSHARDVRVTDPLPEGLMLVTASPSIGTFDAATGLWQIGTLTPAAPAVLRVVAVATRTGTLTNTATILPPPSGDRIDDNPSNDTTSITIPIDGTDVEATRVWWLYNPEQDTLDFYTDLTNIGARPTSGPITVVMPLPEGITFHMGPGDWSCEVVGGTNTVACTRADLTLQPGEQLTLPLWTKGVPPASASIYAHVTYGPDANTANNVALLWPCCGGVDRNIDPSTTPVPVVPAVEAARAAAMLPQTVPAETIDLVVTQQAPAVSIADGARHLTYAVGIRNQGPRDAIGLTVSDAIPAGATVVSASATAGSCATNTVSVVCQWEGLPVGQTASMTVVLASPEVTVLTHTVSASAVDPEGVLTNNQTVLSTALAADPALDTDADGLPNAWETTMGLDPAASDANGDADGDGVTNLEEYVRGTHPRGFFRRYFAEGVSNAFFATELAVVNPDPANPAIVVLTGQREGDGYTHSHVQQLGAMSRYQVTGTDVLAGSGSFSTLLESDVPVAADRIIYWDAHHYGSSVESALPEPSTTWYFAEGATHGFSLYYLLQNPDPARTAQVEVSYLLPAGLPLVKTYSVAPHSRFTIPVHDIPELAATDVSGSIVATNGVPIVAERAMYRDAGGEVMAAGHASAGAPRPETSWFFAEGATGSFFNLYLLLANPEPIAAQVTARSQLPDGTSFTMTYDVAARSRRTISVAQEDPRLAATSVAITLTSTTPIVAERAMWWPGPSVSAEWYEAHDSLGATTTGTKWAIAGGSAGGPDGESTFVLIANQADVEGSATVTVIVEDGTRAEKTFALAPTSRLTVDIAAEFPEARGRAFSAIVESTGGTPVPLVVESSRYGSPRGLLWGSGGAALATKLQ